jgi:hypothetical protein
MQVRNWIGVDRHAGEVQQIESSTTYLPASGKIYVEATHHVERIYQIFLIGFPEARDRPLDPYSILTLLRLFPPKV